MLTHAPSRILATYFRDDVLFSNPVDGLAWPLYRTYLPDDEEKISGVPDQAASVVDTVGDKDGRYHSGQTIFHHGLQFMIRDEDFDTGWSKVKALIEALDAVNRTSSGLVGGTGGSTYTMHALTQTGAPLFLGVKDNTLRRFHWSVNLLATLSED